MRPGSVIIAGGSLAGLFAGSLILQDGWDVHIYERSLGELESRGGGIVLQPEVVEVFNRLGLDPDGPVGVWAEERIFLDRSGRIESRMKTRQKQTSWNAIYSAIRNTFPDERYHQGSTVGAVEQSGPHVVAKINDIQVEADFLIGADGGGSMVRNQIASGATGEYAGYVAYRGLVNESELDESAADILRNRFTFFHFYQSHILVYLVASEDLSVEVGKRRFNWVWYRDVPEGSQLDIVLTDSTGRRNPSGVAPGLLSVPVHTELVSAARQYLPEPMRLLVEATKEPFVQTINDVAVTHMVDRRVALIGDAAFVPRPHTAASTSKAAANALALVDDLRSAPDLASGLKRWEDPQLQFGRFLLSRGRQLGNSSQFPDK